MKYLTYFIVFIMYASWGQANPVPNTLDDITLNINIDNKRNHKRKPAANYAPPEDYHQEAQNPKLAGKPCQINQFRCDDGYCIPIEQKCNKYGNCEDRSDEKPSLCDKSKSCPEFRCDDGHCIRSKQKCDNYNNCQDGSDEKQSICEKSGQSPVAPGSPTGGQSPVAPGSPTGGQSPVAPGSPTGGQSPVAPGPPKGASFNQFLQQQQQQQQQQSKPAIKMMIDPEPREEEMIQTFAYKVPSKPGGQSPVAPGSPTGGQSPVAPGSPTGASFNQFLQQQSSSTGQSKPGMLQQHPIAKRKEDKHLSVRDKDMLKKLGVVDETKDKDKGKSTDEDKDKDKDIDEDKDKGSEENDKDEDDTDVGKDKEKTITLNIEEK